MSVACCFVVSHSEIGPAKALAEWIAGLGGVKDFECILCLTKPAAVIDGESQILPILGRAFGSVTVFVPSDEVEVPWPNKRSDARSPNHMFKRVSQHMEYNVKKPWLWLEMDAIPLKSSWLTELDREYEKGKRPFMGVRLSVGDRPYMSGVAVYPANITRCTPMLRNPGPNQMGGQVPFDVYAGIDTTRQMHETNLIQYVRPNPAGVADWSVSHEEMEPQAVLFHRSKNLALIKFLRGTLENVPRGTNGHRENIPVPTKMVAEFRQVSALQMDYAALCRYHIMALEGLASSAERRNEIVGLLQIAGLVKSPAPLIKLEGVKRARGKPAKKKRVMSPEGRARIVANLEKARAKKKELAAV